LNRSHLPLAVAGAFAVVLLIVLGIYLWPREPVPPSQAELAADYAKGLQYERGSGVSLDYFQALAWYRKAAEAGYPEAEFALGRMTAAGHGMVRDEKAAAEWYRRAADHGLAEAQVQIADDLLTGTGAAAGKPDKVEALKWLLIGADNMPDALSRQTALNTRDALSLEVSAEERLEAARRADEWHKAHAPQQ
jgi:TPR repeat protein